MLYLAYKPKQSVLIINTLHPILFVEIMRLLDHLVTGAAIPSLEHAPDHTVAFLAVML